MRKTTKKEPENNSEIPHISTRQGAMILALKSTLGIVTDACKIIDLDPSTHYKWMKSDAEYKKQVDELQDLALDFVESKLFETIRGVELPEDKIFNHEGVPLIVPTVKRYPPSDANIRWYLDRKGRKRGYIAEPQKSPEEENNESTNAEAIKAMVSATYGGSLPPGAGEVVGE